MSFNGNTHHVIKRATRVKDPDGLLNGKFNQNPIPRTQFFQPDKFDQIPSVTTQKFSNTKHVK
jgi:hypothetical protein